MRRFVLIISAFLMALFPLCGAYAEEQVYIENPDFQYMDAESMPSGWYIDAWYTGDGMTYLYDNDLAQYSDSFWPTVGSS